MSLRTLNAQPSGHVSAFAARKQTVPTTNEGSKPPDGAPSEGGDEYSGSTTVNKRKSALVPAVNQYVEAQWQKSKRRKTYTNVETRLDFSREPPASERSSVEAPQVSLAVAPQDRTPITGASATPGSIDAVVSDSRNEAAQRDSNDEDCIFQLKSRLHSPRDEVEQKHDADYQSDMENLEEYRPVLEDSAASARLVRQLSTFVPSRTNVIDQSESDWTISLEEGDTVTLLGTYDIWIRKGAISILGAILHQSSVTQRIYAPSIHSLPSMKSIWDPFGPARQQTVVTVSSCKSGIRSLRQVSSEFGRIWNYNTLEPEKQTLSVGPMRRTFQLLNVDTDDAYKRPLRPLTFPTDWQSLILTLASQAQPKQPKTMLVCGPKGSGKSTFSRMLANAIMTKPSLNSNPIGMAKASGSIVLLDIDPGQPEFSPPGEISLVKLNCCNFGPPFTHPAATTKGMELIRSHHIGAITPNGDAGHYLQCVSNLFLHYKQLLSQYPSCPLIVNTAGWIQGSGLELLLNLVRNISPTDVVYTSNQGPPEVIETIAQVTDQNKTSVHFLTSQSSEMMPKNSTGLRLMQTLSYFHLDEPENDNLCWNAKPITEATLLSVHYAGPNQSIYGVLLLGHELDPEFITQVLEGSIAGVVVVEDDAALQPLLRVQDLADETDDEMSDHRGDQIDSFSPTQAKIPSCGSIDRQADSIPSPRQDKHTRFLHSNVEPSTSQPCSSYNHTPPLPRTASHIPYIPSANDFTPRVSPSQSHSLGQALIHSIDSANHVLNVITPIPSTTLNTLHQQQKKIILVRGTLETPTWAYKEDLYMQIHRRKRVVKEGLREEGSEAWGKDDTRRWAEGRPWIRPEGRGKGERVRRSRRDLGRKKVEKRE
ncbi:MAG: hypothetical protein Q9188_003994 [Gyalolechia gomerana]